LFSIYPWQIGDPRKWAFLNVLRKIGPDLIHFQFASTANQWSKFLLDSEIPYTVSIRGTDVQNHPHLLPGYLPGLKRTLSGSSGIHCVCLDLKEELLQLVPEIFEEKIHIIYTAISADWSTTFPQNNKVEPHWVSIGRLHWRKGYDTLLIAYSILKRENFGGLRPLFIIGEGEEREKLEYMAKNLGIDMEVHFLGQKSRDEIREYFSSTEIYIQSSLYEGFPNSLGEAMISGIPVVSNNVNGVSEVWLNDYEDLLSNPGQPSSLADSIRKVHSLIERNIYPVDDLQELSMKIFSPEQHANRFGKFWKQALAKKHEIFET
jgi:glycosyltransferase involved in cell wall biosynthesis